MKKIIWSGRFKTSVWYNSAWLFVFSNYWISKTKVFYIQKNLKTFFTVQYCVVDCFCYFFTRLYLLLCFIFSILTSIKLAATFACIYKKMVKSTDSNEEKKGWYLYFSWLYIYFNTYLSILQFQEDQPTSEMKKNKF